MTTVCLTLALLASSGEAAQAPRPEPLAGVESVSVRLKDIASVRWGMETPLLGYGLVFGLEGTGDSRQVAHTVQALANMLRRLGIAVDGTRLQARNVAAVIVTATLSPFAEVGDRLDVTVSAMGDARSLQGGVVLQTPLLAADGAVYAVAQGSVSIGGFNIRAGGESVQKNHPTTGRVVDGALVSQAPPRSTQPLGDMLRVQLRSPDATTATRVAQSINERFEEGRAQVVSPAEVLVTVPRTQIAHPLAFVSDLEQTAVQPDVRAKVVVNERTGTVVIGGGVRLLPTVVSHGALEVEVRTMVGVVQPPPFSSGDTAVVQDTRLKAKERPGQTALLGGDNTVEDLVRALQALRVTPRDLIAILQALKQAGALLAELEIQ